MPQNSQKRNTGSYYLPKHFTDCRKKLHQNIRTKNIHHVWRKYLRKNAHLETTPCWRADNEQIVVGRAALGAPLCQGGFGLETDAGNGSTPMGTRYL